MRPTAPALLHTRSDLDRRDEPIVRAPHVRDVHTLQPDGVRLGRAGVRDAGPVQQAELALGS